jgi:hypothetical protein
VFSFGEPVETKEYGDAKDGKRAAGLVRDRVAAAVEQGISELRQFQRQDPARFVFKWSSSWFAAAYSMTPQAFAVQCVCVRSRSLILNRKI